MAGNLGLHTAIGATGDRINIAKATLAPSHRVTSRASGSATIGRWPI